MNPFHLNPPSYFPLLEGDHEDLSSSLTFNSTSSYSVQYINIYPQKENMDQVEDDYAGDQDKEEGDPMFSPTMSSEDELFSPTSLPTPNYQTNINNFNSFKPLIHEGGDRNANKQCSNESVKWMSSKMRLMKKMMISSSDQTVTNSSITRKEQPSYIRPRSPLHHDHDYEPSNNNSPNNKIRVCSDCNTTKTPLWRSGPQGPKSLCNACGIRQRKAKRAMAAAAANGGLQLAATNTSKNKAIKEKNTQYKKRCKLGAPRSKKKIQFDELKISLSKSSAFHQVFPQDEKEAAILLMALSCGLVH